MRCPTCGHRFKRFSSWPLAAGRAIVCPECGTECKRAGKFMPAIIAVVALIAYNQLIGMFAFTFIGNILLLAAVIILAMTLDEVTISLVSLNPGAKPTPEGEGEATEPAEAADPAERK